MEDFKKRNKQKNLRIKRVPSSRINDASFDLLHKVLSTLESIKKGTIAAKNQTAIKFAKKSCNQKIKNKNKKVRLSS